MMNGRRGTVLGLLLVVALLVSAVGCGTGTVSQRMASPSTARFLRETQPLMEEFLDLTEVAGSTSRIALSPVMIELRRVRREYAALTPPAEAQELHRRVDWAMSATISFIDAFMANQPDANVTRLGREAADAWNYATEELTRLRGIYQ
jgi:hypothetical protein